MHSIKTYLKEHYTQKPIALYGLGREGLSTYQFLREHLPNVVLHLVDDNPHALETASWSELDLRDFTHFYQKEQYYDLLQNNDTKNHPQLLYKTAGIPLSNTVITTAQSKKIPVSSNTQLCFELLAYINAEATSVSSQIGLATESGETHLSSLSSNPTQLHSRGPVTIIGVTGTKGKSTTTSLIHHILTQSKKNSILGGNIGIPPLTALKTALKKYAESPSATHGYEATPTTSRSESQLRRNQKDRDEELDDQNTYLTLELSSHQLQNLQYSPQIAVLLNITPEHLDYYQSFEEYASSKSSIARYQTSQDYVVYSASQPIPKDFAELSAGTKVQISPADVEKVKLKKYMLKGTHNQENIAIALRVAQLIGIDQSIAEKHAQTFSGLAHRLEYIGEQAGVQYYNDSLATTPVATTAALEAFSQYHITVIVGGYDRGLDYTALISKLNQPTITVLGIGQTGKKIVSLLKECNKSNPAQYVETLDQAVRYASKITQKNSVVLLSPASASFDQFKNYEERGNMFKTLLGFTQHPS